MSAWVRAETLFLNRLREIRDGKSFFDTTTMFSGAMPDDRRILADRIRAYGDAARGRSVRLTLEEFRQAIPWIHRSEDALDAAIEASIDTACLEHDSLDAMTAAMLRLHPDIATSIRRSTLLQASMVGLHPKGGPKEHALFTLPCDFGPNGVLDAPRYELRDLIGVGGQGAVFRAVDRLFSDPMAPTFVAVKVFHRSESDACLFDERIARDEAIRSARITHPGVIRAIDHGVHQNQYAYAVFDLVEGKPLDLWVEHREHFDIRTAVRLMISVAEAVEAAHAFGVIHRDLKPSNILIDHRERPRITDFGIARTCGIPLDSKGRYTSRGSLAFMSPEHFACQPESNAPTTDIYGLGGLLYWLLTGNLPNGSDIPAAVYRLERERDEPRKYPSRVPAALQVICERALSHSPVHRYRSATSFAEDLESWLNNRPLRWTDPSLGTRGRLFVVRNRSAVAAMMAGMLAFGAVTWWASARVQHANDLITIHDERLRQTQLASQLRIATERVKAQQEKIQQANSMIRAWKNAIVQTDDMDPARHLSLLAVLSSASLSDTQLQSDLLLHSVETSVTMANETWNRNPDSLEAWLWQLVAGANLLNAGQESDGRIYLENAHHGLAESLPASDPMLAHLQERLRRLRPPSISK